MEIRPIAHFHSPLKEKFGVPRQSSLVEDLIGKIVFTPEYRSPDALRGLEDFDYLWIIWEFSANVDAPKHSTVRPPRLGGNCRQGVFATRSPFRPNNIGLSSVRIVDIAEETPQGPVVTVAGADLMDGTPIYDIKPYIPFTDSHPTARGGFVDAVEWNTLSVSTDCDVPEEMSSEEMSALLGVLAQNPRPQYHDDPTRIYGMAFARWNIRFTIDGDVLHIIDINDAE
jgi:tRNA (adenine37-N6)-methyltransferase